MFDFCCVFVVVPVALGGKSIELHQDNKIIEIIN